MELIEFLRLSSDWFSFSSNRITFLSVISPVVLGIISNFIYDLFKKGDVHIAEEFIYNSLRNFIKEEKIPNPNYIETLIETTAEKYKIDVADLPKASSFIDKSIMEIMNNPLYKVDWQDRVRYQLEWLKQRCKKPWYWKPLQYIEKWIGRLVWMLIFALIWWLLIILSREYFNYTTSFVFAVSIILFFAFILLSIVYYPIYDLRTEEIKYEEIVKAWERYKDKGIKNAKNNEYESAVKFFWQAIETYPAKRTEEYDCRDSFPYMKRDSQKLNEERLDEALDLGELYILLGGNLMNLGEERYDEAMYYLTKGANILEKRVQNDIKINPKRDKREEQIKNMEDSISSAHSLAKGDYQIEFEKVVKRIEEIIKRIRE